MRWPWRRAEKRSTLVSIGDPAAASLLGWGARSFAGVAVNESSALGLSAVYRATALISGTLGTLPLPTYRQIDPETRQRVSSFLDDPGGTAEIDMTPFEWKQTVFLHLTLHADAFLLHQYNGAGAIVGLLPVHPLAVSVRLRREDETQFVGRKVYGVHLPTNCGGTSLWREYDSTQMTQITWMSLDGLRGTSPMMAGANSLGTAVAGDRAAAKMFSSGALISGMVTPEDDLEDGDAEIIKQHIRSAMTGVENAGEIAVLERQLKFTPWTMTAADAQFIESRQFSIEEVARWWGVPPHLLMQMDKQTSWGAGVETQNRAMGRTVLAPWAALVEQRLSRLLAAPRSVEFDFSKLERPTPDTEVKLIIDQIAAGLLTIEEGRHRLGYGPLPAGAPAEPAATEQAGVAA